VVLNLVGGFQALGTLLAVGLMMLPAAAAPGSGPGDVSAMIGIAVGLALLSGFAGLLCPSTANCPRARPPSWRPASSTSHPSSSDAKVASCGSPSRAGTWRTDRDARAADGFSSGRSGSCRERNLRLTPDAPARAGDRWRGAAAR
jgi:hypothetical protein